jgi:hypothetical protein
MTRVAFLYLETLHQIPHSLPIAVALKRANPEWLVDLLTVDGGQDSFIDGILRRLGPDLDFGHRRLERMPVLGALSRLLGIDRREKVASLLWNHKMLNMYDAVVVPERTTTLLKRLGLLTAALIGTEHGAGDRAVTFSPALRLYDFLIVPGEKSATRARELGLVREGHHAVPGYVKLECVDTSAHRRREWFADTKPIVLYTPHFDRRLSSWEKSGEAILDYFAGQQDYNLVFAPHIRLFAGKPEKAATLRAKYAACRNIRIDTGSPNSVDMSYVMNSDIYLGDVSSQIYEFCVAPRPAIFMNVHDSAWENNPDYLFWKCGDVAKSVGELAAILPKCKAHHRFYAAQQKVLTRAAFGDTDGQASQRAAQAITAFLGRPPVQSGRLDLGRPAPVRQSA